MNEVVFPGPPNRWIFTSIRFECPYDGSEMEFKAHERDCRLALAAESADHTVPVLSYITCSSAEVTLASKNWCGTTLEFNCLLSASVATSGYRSDIDPNVVEIMGTIVIAEI